MRQGVFGANLIAALGSGQGWVLETQQLARLSEFAVTPTQKESVQQFIAATNQNPKSISLDSWAEGRFQIAQYRASSLEAALAKLQQFPKRTAFA